MKSFFTIFCTLSTLILVSCDQHSWEDEKDAEGNVIYPGTKRFYTEHHGDSHGGDHGDSHDSHDSHDAHDSHGEEKHGGDHGKSDAHH